MLKEEHRLFLNRAIEVMAWRMDVESDEMIEQIKDGIQYCKSHLSVKGTISQRDLEAVCATVNEVLYQSSSDLMVSNFMGKFIPAKRK